MKTIENVLQSHSKTVSFDELVVQLRKAPLVEVKSRKDGITKYINGASCLDTETSTFGVPRPLKYHRDGTPKKQEYDYYSFMYCWALNYEGYVITGRTTESLVDTLNLISMRLRLTRKYRFVVYIHNLAYEFQFLHRWFKWERVFARERRKPMRALTTTGIEFRCSYFLSGMGAANLAKELRIPDFTKLEYNYKLIRHHQTPLTQEEWEYQIRDTEIVVEYIRSEIKRNEGSIAKIPYTKTSYVRRALQKAMYAPQYAKASYRLMRSLTVELNEYYFLRDCFTGGYTHANSCYTEMLCTDMWSLDLASSYPANMCTKYFPMSKGVYTQFQSETEMRKVMCEQCVVVKLTFFDLQERGLEDYWLSSNKILCPPFRHRKVLEQSYNGRIRYTPKCTVILTEVDFSTFEKFYKWGRMEIGGAYVYERGYLPKPIIELTATLYAEKTSFKDLEGMEYRYNLAKEFVNSEYGCSVTDIVPEIIEYMDGWKPPRTQTPDEALDTLKRYNKKYQRTLFYPWGIYITAWTRNTIFEGIIEFGPDYHYTDTDSLKVENIANHMDWINAYNDKIDRQIQDVCDFYDLDKTLFYPNDINGYEHPLGHWEIESHIEQFMALRAKCYGQVYQKINPDGTWSASKFKLTIAGVNPTEGGKYLESIGGIMKLQDDLTFPSEHSGKLTGGYCDTEFTMDITDYLGNTAEVHERCFVSLVEKEYSINLSEHNPMDLERHYDPEILQNMDYNYLVFSGNCDIME